MEFNGGIIAKELDRCSMIDDVALFASIVRNGLCIMDPNIGRWLTRCMGEDDGSNKTVNVLKFETIVNFTVTEKSRPKLRSVGLDASLCREVGYALIGISDRACDSHFHIDWLPSLNFECDHKATCFKVRKV